MYDPNQEWKLVMAWGIFLANESGIFDGANEQLLNLVCYLFNIFTAPSTTRYFFVYEIQ